MPYRVASLALAAILLAAMPAGAVEATAEAASAADCSIRYQAEFQSIAAGPYATLKAAKPALQAGSNASVGAFIFPPQSTRRTTQEVNALRAGGMLVRMQGGGDWMGNAESRWIVEQIRADLGEYLTQPVSPYLCGGVAGYVEQLRAFRDRVGVSPRRFAALADVQDAAARRSMATAFELVSQFQPGMGAVNLRPSQTDIATARKADASAAATVVAPASLLSEDARLEALDELVAAAVRAGVLPADVGTRQTAGAVPPAGATPVAGVPRPVLGRLAGLRQPILMGLRSMETQRVRRSLMIALSDLEVLDYLAAREDDAPDPILSAIDETLDAILLAHEKASAVPTETAQAADGAQKPAVH